jgi:hypothetical protein
MLILARLTCLLAVLGFSGALHAQTVSQVTPANVAIGSTLEITGSGFGAKKPKVQLFNHATGKKYALKVVDFTDSVIHATVSKGVVGDLELQVIVKGAPGPAVGPAPISFEAPLVTSLSVAQAAPDAPFTINGDFFGIKKGKVRVNGQNAKVVSWAMNQIQLLMPKKLANGFWQIAVDNKVGVDTGATIEVVGSLLKLGKVQLNATVGGTALKLKLTATISPGGFGVIAFGTSGTNPSKSLMVAVPFFNGTSVPQHYLAGQDFFTVSYVEVKLSGGFSSKTFVPKPGHLVVNITANSAGQVAGDFSGILKEQFTGEEVSISGNFISEFLP